MIRITVYIALLLFAIYGIATLVDHPGAVTIAFERFELNTSFAALAFATALLMLIASLILYVWIWLKTDAPIIGKNRIYKQQRQGFDYMNQSMLALAAGDISRARRLIGNAETLLPPQPMVQLIAAEAATRDGDHAAAHKQYRALEKDDNARFLGLRGLIGEARRNGRAAEALKLAKDALTENKKSTWALDTIFQLEIAAGDWAAAQATLKNARKMHLYDDETAKRHGAALFYAESLEQSLAGNMLACRKSLTHALKDRPDFIAAADQLARLEYGDNKKGKAEKILNTAYGHNPHPELIATLLNLNPTVSDMEWREKLNKLVKGQSEHATSLVALAQAELACDYHKESRKLLEAALETNPTQAAWALMAHLIDAEGGDSQHAHDKSNSAAVDPSWECDSCGQNLTRWFTICPSCDGFDCISWGDHTLTEHRASRAPTQTVVPLTLLEENITPPSPAEG